MGVTGVSYGGQMCNWITTHTDRFKASIPVSGTSNLLSGYGINANLLWPESDINVRSYDDLDRLWAVSPLKYSHADPVHPGCLGQLCCTEPG